jgi:hypothetical protein
LSLSFRSPHPHLECITILSHVPILFIYLFIHFTMLSLALNGSMISV